MNSLLFTRELHGLAVAELFTMRVVVAHFSVSLDSDFLDFADGLYVVSRGSVKRGGLLLAEFCADGHLVVDNARDFLLDLEAVQIENSAAGFRVQPRRAMPLPTS